MTRKLDPVCGQFHKTPSPHHSKGGLSPQILQQGKVQLLQSTARGETYQQTSFCSVDGKPAMKRKGRICHPQLVKRVQMDSGLTFSKKHG